MAMRIMTMRIEEARQFAGLSRVGMARPYKIPIRTLENWNAGTRQPPVWAEMLIIEKLERMKNGEA